MGFCSDNCRKSYHKHGGAYRKLRAEVRKMLEKEAANMRTELSLAVRILVEAETRRLNAEVKELRSLWIETESRYVALKAQNTMQERSR